LSYTAPHWAAPAFYLSYNTPFWTTLHPVELWCSLLSYPLSPYWAMLYLSELRCTLWAMLHLTEPRGPIELRCTLLSYTAPPYELAHRNWATLHPTELGWAIPCFAVPYWVTLFSTELRSTRWATIQPNWVTFSTHSFAQFFQSPECWTVQYRNKGTPDQYRNATGPDWDVGCQNTNASGMFGLDANAQLWSNWTCSLVFTLSNIFFYSNMAI